ncbi:MAG TPA: hypothetical protein VGT08_21650 [Terracidiphilus sp.]|nr:hypothetical protein [Terracidiphilus sp.]
MRRMLMTFAVLTFASTLAHGQSARAHLGVDCSHPNIEQRPSAPACDASCRQSAQERNEEYWKRREEYAKQQAEEKQRRNEQKAHEKATKEENKRIAEANRLAD